jgi:hypothetical protein
VLITRFYGAQPPDCPHIHNLKTMTYGTALAVFFQEAPGALFFQVMIWWFCQGVYW